MIINSPTIYARTNSYLGKAYPSGIDSFEIRSGNLVLNDYHTVSITSIRNESKGSMNYGGFENRGFQITMSGTIDNYGTFRNDNLNGEYSWYLAYIRGTDTTITNYSGATFENGTQLQVKTINNQGTFAHRADTVAYNNSSEIDSKNLTNPPAHKVGKDVSAKVTDITNSGTFLNGGRIATNYRPVENSKLVVSGSFTNEASGVLENYGTIENTNAIDNKGTINSLGGIFTGAITTGENSTINVYALEHKGNYTYKWGSPITKFQQTTTFENNGKFSIESGATADFASDFTNNAGKTLTNNGTLTLAAGKTLTNKGTINAGDSTFNNAVTQSQGGVINVNGYTTFKETVTTSTGSSINVADYQTANFSKAFTNVKDAKFIVGNSASAYTSAIVSGAVSNSGEMIVTGGVYAGSGFTNEAGGKITFKKATNSGNAVLSQILLGSGTFKNEGLIFVDISGLDLNKGYSFVSLVSGTINYDDGFKEVKATDSKGVVIANTPGAYTYDASTGTITITAFDYGSGSDANDKAAQDALTDAAKNAGVSMTLDDMRKATSDIKTTLQESVIAQPRAMMNAFKMDSSAAQLQGAIAGFMAESAGVYYAAASSHIMSDAVRVRGAKRKSADDGRLQIFATPFGGGLSGDGASGFLMGVALGATYFGSDYIAQGNFAYARASSSQDLDLISNETTGNLVQIGGFGRYFLGKAVEIDANVNFVYGGFDLENSWGSNLGAFSSKTSFSDFEFNLGATGGYRFDELGKSEVARAFSVKPFAGLQLYYERQGEIALGGSGLTYTSEALGDFMMDILAGVEGRYAFKNGNFAYLKLGYEQKLFNTQKDFAVRTNTATLTYDNESYNGFLSANVGGRVLSINSWRLDIEGVFKHYDSGLNYFGGNLSVRYAF